MGYTVYPEYPKAASFALGVTQIVLGGASIILNIASAALHERGISFAQGIICGILFIVSGVFAILASRTKEENTVKAVVGLSIASVVICLIALAVTALHMLVWAAFFLDTKARYPLGLMMGVLGIGFFVALGLSIAACMGVCSLSQELDENHQPVKYVVHPAAPREGTAQPGGGEIQPPAYYQEVA